MIGRHAVQHIEWSLEYLAERPWMARRAEWKAEAHKQELIDALRQILAYGGHRALNRALRRAWAEQPTTDPSTVEPRLLLGWHDVEEFANATATLGWVRQTVRRVAAHESPASR